MRVPLLVLWLSSIAGGMTRTLLALVRSTRASLGMPFLVGLTLFGCMEQEPAVLGDPEGPDGVRNAALESEVLGDALTAGQWPSDPLVVTNSVLLDQRAAYAGSISAVRAATGAVLSQNAELTLAADAVLTGTVRADTIYLATRAEVRGAAATNGKQGPGTVTGAVTSPLALPLAVTIPALPNMVAGTQAVTLASNEQRTLSAGSVGAVTLSQGNAGQTTRLTLSGGIYVFSALTLGTDARVECAAACEVSVVGRTQVGARSFVGPTAGSGLGAGNVQLFVKGSNGSAGPSGTPAALYLDNDAQLQAYALVPNGTARTAQRVLLRGKLVAKDIWLGIDANARGLQLAVISQQPQSQTVWERQTASFSVTAALPPGGSSQTISYQWQKNGTNIPGKTAATLSFPAAVGDDQAQFRVVISSEAGPVVSNAGTLTVIPCQPVDNDCDGVDDDCSGAADEDFVPTCQGAERVTCSAGQLTPAACDNGQLCDGIEACVAGVCIPGQGASSALGAIGLSCDDGDPSNGAEACDSAGECVKAPTKWGLAPVRLSATGPFTGAGGGGQAGPGTGRVETIAEAPADVEIPQFIPVAAGNAGRGTLHLDFERETGESVTCTYQGAALSDHPVELLDRMLGLRYRFISCTDGSQPGRTVRAAQWGLNVLSGDDEFSGGPTQVQLDLGGGCSGTIPAAMPPSEVVALRTGFNWGNFQPLPERNPQGKPAIWHGLIYIENKDQLLALDQMGVLWSAQPFTRDYHETMQGKCGMVEHSTDGFGVLVYAIFPAKLWNILQEYALQMQAVGKPPPFSFFAPSSPNEPGALESDGSLSYEALADVGYPEWLAQHLAAQPGWGLLDVLVDVVSVMTGDVASLLLNNYTEDVLDASETLFDYTVFALVSEAVPLIMTFLDDVWEEIQQGLSAIIRAFEPDLRMRLKVSMKEIDPGFAVGSPLIRAWGPPVAGQLEPLLDSAGRPIFDSVLDGVGNPVLKTVVDANGNPITDYYGQPILVPEVTPRTQPMRPHLSLAGAKIRVRQFFGFLPTMAEAVLPEGDSQVSLLMLRYHQGTTTRPEVCIQMDADFGVMTSDVIPNEVCDYRGPNGDITGDFYEDSFDIQSPSLYDFAQIKDGYDYLKQVVGHEPYRAEVLVGWTAADLTGVGNQGVPQTLCLGFPGSISSLAATFPGAGMVTAPLYAKDIWWSSQRAFSRSVMTHEYGHFAMCSMLFDQEGVDGLRGLLDGLGAKDEGRSSENRLMTETIADAFALQVAGGVQYFRPSRGGTLRDQFVASYCANPPCVDSNFSGVDPSTGQNTSDMNDAFGDEVARWQTLVFDAFDRAAPEVDRNQNNFFKGDYWTTLPLSGGSGASTVLGYDPDPFIGNSDEFVELPGSAWVTWMNKWLQRTGATGAQPNVDNVMGALTDAMAQHGVNWCNRCEVFALHSPPYPKEGPASDPSEPVAATNPSRFARWSHCTSDVPTQGLVGAPPEPFLNLDFACNACPSGQRHDHTAGCTACALDEVPRGLTCESCGAGLVPAGNLCVACGVRDIEVLDTAGTQHICQTCPVGMGSDASRTACIPCALDATLDAQNLTECGTSLEATGTGTTPGDNCPGEFWVEVTAGASPVHLSADVPNPVTAEECASTQVQALVQQGAQSSVVQGLLGAWCAGVQDPACGGVCICQDSCMLGVTIGDFSATTLRVRIDSTPLNDITRTLTVTPSQPVDCGPGPL